MKTTTIAAAAFALVGALSTAAFAAPATGDVQNTTISVALADVNLASNDGAATAFARIKNAAERACDAADLNAVRDLTLRAAVRECVAVATAKAVSDLNAPLVVALARGDAPVSLVARNDVTPAMAR